MAKSKKTRRRRARTSSVMVPRAPSTLRTATRPARLPPFQRQLREVGTELFAVGNVGNTSYDQLVGYILRPASMGIRLKMLSRLYEMYKVNSLTFEVILTGPTTAAASLIQAVDIDPTDPAPAENLDGVTAMSAWRHSQAFAFLDGSTPKLVVKPESPTPRGFYCSYDPTGDLRQTYCGTYFLYVLTAVTGVGYSVRLHYDITFTEPELDDAQIGGSITGVSGALYNPLGSADGFAIAPWATLCAQLAAAAKNIAYIWDITSGRNVLTITGPAKGYLTLYDDVGGPNALHDYGGAWNYWMHMIRYTTKGATPTFTYQSGNTTVDVAYTGDGIMVGATYEAIVPEGAVAFIAHVCDAYAGTGTGCIPTLTWAQTM